MSKSWNHTEKGVWGKPSTKVLNRKDETRRKDEARLRMDIKAITRRTGEKIENLFD